MKKETMTTKEKILIATLELATEKGLGEVSLSQIAKQVGIQKPSLYNHFSSREELILSLYEYLREAAKDKAQNRHIDYGEFVKEKSAYEVLSLTVHSYMAMNEDANMSNFYKFITSERSIHKEAASIMVAETEKMILATKQLFYAMQVQHIMEFENVDLAAFSFAMAVHSIMDYMYDQRMAEMENTVEKMLENYLKDFCSVYSKHCKKG